MPIARTLHARICPIGPSAYSTSIRPLIPPSRQSRPRISSRDCQYVAEYVHPAAAVRHGDSLSTEPRDALERGEPNASSLPDPR